MVDKKGLKLKQPMKSILPKINSFLANKFQHHTQSSQIHPLLLPGEVPTRSPTSGTDHAEVDQASTVYLVGARKRGISEKSPSLKVEDFSRNHSKCSKESSSTRLALSFNGKHCCVSKSINCLFLNDYCFFRNIFGRNSRTHYLLLIFPLPGHAHHLDSWKSMKN